MLGNTQENRENHQNPVVLGKRGSFIESMPDGGEDLPENVGMALQWSKIMLFPHLFDGRNTMPANILLKREVPPCLLMIFDAFLYIYNIYIYIYTHR